MITASDEILAALQRAFNTVRTDGAALSRDDDLAADLALDSIDAIDLMSALEDGFSSDVIDAVIESMPQVRTVGDLVDAIQRALTRTPA